MNFFYLFFFAVSLSGCLKTDNEKLLPRILFLGNSITWSHPSPSGEWYGDWGMAASELERDYVHQTIQKLEDSGLKTEFGIGKRNYYGQGPIEENIANMREIRIFNPEYVIVQLGEHPSSEDVISGKLTEQYSRLLDSLSALNTEMILCLSPWMDVPPYDRSDAVKKAVDIHPGAVYIDTRPVYSDSSNLGSTELFQNPGILWHPGDQGMAAIAEMIADLILDNEN